jgi:hypothetical protein
MTGWLAPSAGQKIPVQPWLAGTFLPQQKIPLAENRYLQASKVAENSKEKSKGKIQAVLYTYRRSFKKLFWGETW